MAWNHAIYVDHNLWRCWKVQRNVDWLGIKLQKFYNVGAKTILTKNPANPGDDETFYLHVLRFYLPQIAKKTMEDHGVGLGIFSMQGFERRNKESKNTLRRFSNRKGNVLLNNLRRLYDVFFYEQTGVWYKKIIFKKKYV